MGALLAVVGLALVAIVALRDTGPDHPEAWDPRLADLVAFVEAEKGAPFDHPVYVDLLDADAFDAEVTVDDADLTDEEREEVADTEAILRAFGVASGDVGLLDSLNAIETGGTLAYYDQVDDRITVDGTELDVARSVTVVHELTHAWQDQHYGIDRFDDFEDPAEDEAFRAIVEGDASRTEDAYLRSLSDDELADYDEGLDDQLEDFDATAVPSLLLAEQSAPYALGPAFLDVLTASGDAESVLEDVFADPPVSAEQLLDPAAYLAGDLPEPLDAPAVPGGGDALDEGTLGATSLFLMVAEREEPMVALAAGDAWQADAYVAGEVDGRVCVAHHVRLEAPSAGAPDAIDAYLRWVDTLPDATASVDGRVVQVLACDPGPDADIEVIGRAEEVLSYPVVRLYLLAELVGEGAQLDDPDDAAQAHCFAEGFLGQLSPEDLVDDAPDRERMDRLMTDAIASCA